MATLLFAGQAYAQNTVDGIFCGTPLARHLNSGATDSFVTSLLPGTVVSADVIATTNPGLLRLQPQGFTSSTGTCNGDLPLTATSIPGTIGVSNCFSTDTTERDYTISLSVVSSGSGNCAAALPCGTGLPGRFETAGEVDSYSFPGIQGDTISFGVTDVSPSTQMRLRLFSPTGTLVYDGAQASPTCPSSFRLSLPANGTYTALVSTCGLATTAAYKATWQPPDCVPAQPSGQFAYVTNADSGTMSVVDLSSNTAKLTLPIVPQGLADLGTPTFLAITPNGGFAWATYETASATSVVNTSTNLLVASVPTGLEANGVAISPDGTTAFVVSNAYQGLLLVDTMTNKVTRVAELGDIGFLQGIEPVTLQDGTFLLVLSEDEGLLKVNTTDYMIDATAAFEVGNYDAFAASPDASFVYAGTLEGITVIDTSIFMPTASIAIGNEPFGIAFTADGKTAYATIPDSSVVVVIDTATNHVVGSIDGVGDSPGGIAISPNTGLAYVTDFTAPATEPGVFVIDTKTNRVIASLPTLGDGPTAIQLTTAPTGLCVGNAQGQCDVTIDEITKSVGYALDMCPGRFPPNPTPAPLR